MFIIQFLLKSIVDVGISRIFTGLGIAAGIGAFVYVWTDYRTQGEHIASLNATIAEERRIYTEAAESYSQRTKQLLNEVETVRKAAKRRTAEGKALQDQINTLKGETHDENTCPIHPSIEFAIDELRGQSVYRNDN